MRRRCRKLLCRSALPCVLLFLVITFRQQQVGLSEHSLAAGDYFYGTNMMMKNINMSIPTVSTPNSKEDKAKIAVSEQKKNSSIHDQIDESHNPKIPHKFVVRRPALKLKERPYNQLSSNKALSRNTKRAKVMKVAHCITLKAASPPVPVTALASFPGSGNTWLRHLLQELTGLMTGSMHADPYLMNSNFPGEKLTDGKALVVKTHSMPGAPKKCKRAIILLRNPYNSLLADFNRHNDVNSNEHTGFAPEKLFNGQGWRKRALLLGPLWYEFYDAWLDFDRALLVLTYEDLKNNIEGTLKRIVRFLGLNIPEKNYHCMLNNTEGAYHRKSKTFETQLFSKKSIELVNFFGGLLKDRLSHHNVTMDFSVPD